MNLFELFVKIGVEDKASPAMKNTQKNSETLTNKMKVLSSQFDSAKENINKLTDAFNKSVKETGVASKETQDLARKLDDAEKEAKQLANRLDEASDEANQASNQFSKFSGITLDTVNGSELLGKSLSVTGSVISTVADVAMKAITVAFEVAAAAAAAFMAALTALNVEAVKSYSNFEQLAGGAAKIFDQMDQAKILKDASNAYKDLGISANQYLSVLNDVGATFAATMGDKAGYETARKGLLAISDYASGTGKSVDELSAKFTLITRSTSSYQSIADQFSGILPATSKDFLAQAQSVGLLSSKYEELTKVPIAEYQKAVAGMLEIGVQRLGLAGNTVAEANSTISGSLASTKAAWEDLMVAFVNGGEDFDRVSKNFLDSATTTVGLIIPKVGDVLENVPKLINSVVSLVLDGIPKEIEEGASRIFDATLNIVNSISRSIVENQDKIVGAIESIFQFVTNKMSDPSTYKDSAMLVGRLFQTIVKVMTKSAPILIKAMADVLNDIAKLPETHENIRVTIEAVTEMIRAITVALLESSPQINEAFLELVWAIIKALSTKETLQTISNAVKDIIFSLRQAIENNRSPIMDEIDGLIDDVIQHILDFDLAEAGAWLVESIKTGMDNAWADLTAWFKEALYSLLGGNGIGLDFFKTGGFGIDGSHANGLDYVPSDGYIAELHKGERVLTANEARGYGGNSFGDIHITIDGARYDDEESLARSVAEAIQDLTYRKEAVYA